MEECVSVCSYILQLGMDNDSQHAVLSVYTTRGNFMLRLTF